VRRVVVHPDRIEVEIGKQKLRSALVGEPRASSHQAVPGQMQKDSTDVIRLEIEARVKRCGGEMRLVLPPDPRGHVRSHSVSSLMKALARAHQWHEWVVSGEVSGQRAIARRLGLNERYVSRVLQCAFLAPDIVEAILDGRQPSNLSLERLTDGLPLNWIEQRKQLGFPPLHPRQYGNNDIYVDSLHQKAALFHRHIRESNFPDIS
jgi:site-specific DNA recombinase